MSDTLRGSLAVFPLDIVLGMLAEARATGRLRLGDEPDGHGLEVTDGVPTAALSRALVGDEGLGALIEMHDAAFEFVPGPTGARNLALRMQDLMARIRISRERRAAPIPGPGPATLRLRALRGVLPPLAPEERTVAGVRVLGPQHPRPETTADPLWSSRHLGALLNAMLFLYLGGDAKRRRAEAEGLLTSALPKVPGVERPLPLGRDGVDLDALGGALYGGGWAVGLLHAMIRELFEDADAVHEGTHAERAYVAAVEHTLGGGEGLRVEALRVVGAGRRLRARITVTAGGSEGPFPLEEREHAIGRSAANDVKLEHPSVSRRHARLVPRSGRYVITDVGSTAGTWVNGERLEGERVLRSGDTIAVGDVALRLDHLES